jgi:hypothetical protein
MAVCGITSDMEPNLPVATAAGSAVVSDDEVNSRKYAAAVAVSWPFRQVSCKACFFLVRRMPGRAC